MHLSTRFAPRCLAGVMSFRWRSRIKARPTSSSFPRSSVGMHTLTLQRHDHQNCVEATQRSAISMYGNHFGTQGLLQYPERSGFSLALSDQGTLNLL